LPLSAWGDQYFGLAKERLQSRIAILIITWIKNLLNLIKAHQKKDAPDTWK
jgi:hypothetical protein